MTKLGYSLISLLGLTSIGSVRFLVFSLDLDKCCKEGYIPARASCVLRARYWMAGASKICKEEFLRCCFNATGEKGIKIDRNCYILTQNLTYCSTWCKIRDKRLPIL